MKITTLLIDLDDTVYSADCGLWSVIGGRIEQYMLERLQIPLEEIHPYRVWLYNTYGTTLRGLKATRAIDGEDYLAYVHDVPLAEFIRPDPQLRRVLLDQPYKKYIFTNSDMNHTHRVLNILELTDCFDGIIDIKAVDPHCKPLPGAYEIALKIVDEEPGHCVMFDDSMKNLAEAHQWGISTVHVSEKVVKDTPDFIPRIASLLELPDVLSRLETGEEGR